MDQSIHFYPTPTPTNRPNGANTGNHNTEKRIVIQSEYTNVFNNGTFFIMLQIMILLYFPAASLLAPYYEDNPPQTIDSNFQRDADVSPTDIIDSQSMEMEETHHDIASWRLSHSELDEHYYALRRGIESYGPHLFPTFAGGP